MTDARAAAGAPTPTRMAHGAVELRELQALRRNAVPARRPSGRFQGELTLTLGANADVNVEFLHYLDALEAA